MARDHTPYDYGGVDTDAGLDDRNDAARTDEDLVVVDGTTMSYRRYCRDGGEGEP